MIEWGLVSLFAVAVLYLLCGFRVVRQTERGLVETFGKFTRFANPGLTYVFPIFQNLIRKNITESMTQIEPQEIITKDNLNAQVDLVVYYKIKNDEKSVFASEYNVNDVISQIEVLSRTTARNVIGTMPFRDVNSERNDLNKKLLAILSKEASNWGVEVLKVELKEIVPPKDVQDTMNSVIKAENSKTAAIDMATAAETVADGKRRAAIKEAQGIGEAKIIVAKAEAERIKLVNEAGNKYFVGNAQKLKALEVTQASLETNSKIILTEKGISPTLLIGSLGIGSTTKGE